jgi:HD-like signal output (HDOD) protein
MSDPAATVDRLLAAMQGVKGFPALESTVASVISSLGNELCEADEVVGHVVEDFALTQKVLKLANSAMYAPFSAGSGNVSSALGVLGNDALMHLVLSTAVATETEMQADSALSRTLLSSELARTVCTHRSEEVAVAALMYDLGSLLAQKYLAADCATIAKRCELGHSEDATSIEIWGLTLQQLGAEVARRWKLPASIVSVIDGTGDQDLVAIARFSSAASVLIHAGRADEADALLGALDVTGIDRAGVASLIRTRAERLTPVPPAAPTVSSAAVLDDLFAALTSDGKQTVEALAAAMFPTFGLTLQTAHCLLFMLTRSGDFAVRYGYGKGIDELRSRLRISKDYKPTAFHAAIKNNVDVSIADVSRLKSSALPESYRELLPNVNQFVILPITTSGVTGLFYCDWDADKVLSPSELAAVKKLRNLFVPLFPP